MSSYSHQVREQTNAEGRLKKVIRRYDAATGKYFFRKRDPKTRSALSDLELEYSGTVLNYLHGVGQRACKVSQAYLS